ncbi:SIS domain-containing protein [Azospirillum griseum]|uniref:SIS domain-containing protein n=1 Tax=Azospirillum griseum TaxID=2496639 RepID=A0A431VJE0_9PROT|nr:SIS domain-containing protein [Azospirillum griseum]RTR22071.1 SIS domain-containing protein [Azospirillum griseum]
MTLFTLSASDPRMAFEAAEAADTVTRLAELATPALAALGDRLRANPPPVVITCARGSSDHASLYGKYLIETHLDIPVASVGPSIASIYGRRLSMTGALFIAVSQSGRSPDLLSLTRSAKEAGAIVVGFVNDLDSPLPALCDLCVPLSAGPELSVAATKSCLSAMAAFLLLTAQWSRDPALLAEIAALPDTLRQAATLDWHTPLQALTAVRDLYIVGRGAGFGVANEMALKCKETSRLHAEAVSAAEVLHGPLALVGPGFPVLALSQPDASADTTRHIVERIVGLGGPVLTTVPDVAGSVTLPTVPDVGPATAPLAALQSFYMAIGRIARERGLDPDAPANLRKVTETI